MTFREVPSNGTIVNAALHNLDRHLQGQTFLYKNAQPPDVPGRFASTRTAPAVFILSTKRQPACSRLLSVFSVNIFETYSNIMIYIGDVLSAKKTGSA